MRGAARRESSSFAWSTPPEDVGGFNFLRSVYYMDPCIRIRTYQVPCNGSEQVQLDKGWSKGNLYRFVHRIPWRDPIGSDRQITIILSDEAGDEFQTLAR